MSFGATLRLGGHVREYPATDVLRAERITPLDCLGWERLLVGPDGALALYLLIAKHVDCDR